MAVIQGGPCPKCGARDTDNCVGAPCAMRPVNPALWPESPTNPALWPEGADPIAVMWGSIMRAGNGGILPSEAAAVVGKVFGMGAVDVLVIAMGLLA
jgi:hypothetical protein